MQQLQHGQTQRNVRNGTEGIARILPFTIGEHCCEVVMDGWLCRSSFALLLRIRDGYRE
jgi:hypothetical protein